MGNTVGDPSPLHFLTFIQAVLSSIVSPSWLYFLWKSFVTVCLTPTVVVNELSASLISQNFAYCSQTDLSKERSNHVTIVLKSLSQFLIVLHLKAELFGIMSM